MVSVSATQSMMGRPSCSLEVYLLGVVDFDTALLLQERLVYEISGRNDTLAALLLCEHPPIVTIGRDGSRQHVDLDPDELLSRQMEVRWLNRGGGSLIHAPGQLAVYPILPLDRLRIGLADYRSRLEGTLQDLAGELHIPCDGNNNDVGICCRSGQFGHVGVAVKSWVAYHGLFVNVCPPMDLLRLAQPNPGHPVTSLATERGRASMHRVRETVMRRLAVRLGYTQSHLYTGHPLLQRPKKTKRSYVNA